MSAAAERYQDGQPRAYTTVAGLLGLTALVAAIWALVTANTTALAVLVAATLVLWLAATVRHALGTAAHRGSHPHDVVHPQH